MTKQEVKDLCEDDLQLQFWAMVLFAEINTIAERNSWYRNDDKAIADYVRLKVDEFPHLIVMRRLQKVQEKLKKEGSENGTG